MTKENELLVYKSLLRLFAQLDIHTDGDRELIHKLYELVKESK